MGFKEVTTLLEYIYDTIKATAGEDLDITAYVVDENGDSISQGCRLILRNGDESVLAVAEGIYNADEGMWHFHVPGERTAGLKGKHWYCVKQDDETICFLEPFYLI